MLGCGAHLAALRRTSVGRFGLDSAHALEVLQGMNADLRDRCLLPVDTLLQNLAEVRLDPEEQARFVRGQTVQRDGTPQARVRVYGAGGALLGVGEAAADGTVYPKRIIANVATTAQDVEAQQKIDENP
jgi:tRNA pseudouridine55 synthase